MDRLHRLHETFGQSPWLDNLRRNHLTSGTLAALRDRGVRGLTSNPTIFQKAIQGSDDYDEQFHDLATAGGTLIDHYWAMVGQDIDGACSVFAPVHDASDGADGYVSAEVDPSLAHDTHATIAAARTLHRTIDRDNLMVKIPATEAGLPAIRRMIAEGRNVNVTLIFGLDRHRAVMEAYLAGLEDLARDPDADLSTVASVASFFISRVDSETDRRLDDIGTAAARALRGRAAIAQGRLAYQQFLEAFTGPRWEALAARGARLQRPLWASTSTKDPAYPDTLYVDELIGPDTVNTLPEPTLEAFSHHGALARRVDADLEDARSVWAGLAEVGIDMEDVATRLEQQGVASFQKSFDELLGALQAKRDDIA